MNSLSDSVEQEEVEEVERFFYDNIALPYEPLPFHTLENSPCYPIIGIRTNYKVPLYQCRLHPKAQSAHLDMIEHHCKYQSPASHKARIFQKLGMMSEAEADKIVEEDRKIQKEKEGKSKLLKPSSISDDSNNNGENNSQ